MFMESGAIQGCGTTFRWIVGRSGLLRLKTMGAGWQGDADGLEGGGCGRTGLGAHQPALSVLDDFSLFEPVEGLQEIGPLDALSGVAEFLIEYLVQHHCEKGAEDVAADGGGDLASLGYDGSYNRVAAFARAWKEECKRLRQSTGRGTFVPLALRRIDVFLLRWVRRKFKHLRQQPKGARNWRARVVRSSPGLLGPEPEQAIRHERIGMTAKTQGSNRANWVTLGWSGLFLGDD